jgi:hypothetical protein
MPRGAPPDRGRPARTEFAQRLHCCRAYLRIGIRHHGRQVPGGRRPAGLRDVVRRSGAGLGIAADACSRQCSEGFVAADCRKRLCSGCTDTFIRIREREAQQPDSLVVCETPEFSYGSAALAECSVEQCGLFARRGGQRVAGFENPQRASPRTCFVGEEEQVTLLAESLLEQTR